MASLRVASTDERAGHQTRRRSTEARQRGDPDGGEPTEHVPDMKLLRDAACLRPSRTAARYHVRPRVISISVLALDGLTLDARNTFRPPANSRASRAESHTAAGYTFRGMKSRLKTRSGPDAERERSSRGSCRWRAIPCPTANAYRGSPIDPRADRANRRNDVRQTAMLVSRSRNAAAFEPQDELFCVAYTHEKVRPQREMRSTFRFEHPPNLGQLRTRRPGTDRSH